MSRPRRLSVVIPAFNEKSTIGPLIERVRTAELSGWELEIVVVDDGSRDGTGELLEKIPGITLRRHPANKGKGAALKTGFAAATGDLLLIQDADLEYDPGDYPVLLAPFLAGRADVVMGSRFAYERPHFFFGERLSPFFSHYIGNITITGLTNLLYGYKATDYYACYKVFRANLARAVPVEADGFDFDNEFLCKLLRLGVRIEEVPVRYSPRSYEDGKKIKWKDGFKVIWSILKWRFKSFRCEKLPEVS